MFTGIVTAIGSIQSVEQHGGAQVTVRAPFDPGTIAIGASISCSGVCLTVVDRGGEKGDAWFTVDVSVETMRRTVPDMWEKGRRLNLEPALRVGDELGGHLVTGHVDGVGDVRMAKAENGSIRLAIRASRAICPFIAEKGSITVDGVSLTVNDVRDRPDGTCDFALNIIPHTAEVTTLGALKEGDRVNLEIDVLARYLKRLESVRR
ncbi:riboflavin synthase [Qipengyuania sp. MTN3-11]|uniref:riboflavin synthase n=1 Tax=Qipengyuania sp. MTN3-11 TaxID=3056557 RepID=UPI0036F3D0BB